ncbi:hypothetical protein [Luteococcus sp.]|uniref:hypothetical protein n=1 Tax=Luteococcus sp. TaxID=1969402 RepID=UPI003736E6C2
MRSHTRTSAALSAALLVTSLLAGCSGPEPASPPTFESPAASSPATQPSATPLPQDPPVATRRAVNDGINFTLDLYPLRRQGQSVLLTARLTATDVPAGGAEIGDGWSLLGTVHDTTNPNHGLDNGFKLVEATGTVVHLPARIDGVDTCTGEHHSVWQKGDVQWVSCLFAIPKAESRTMTVQVQNFGGYADVPLH